MTSTGHVSSAAGDCEPMLVPKAMRHSLEQLIARPRWQLWPDLRQERSAARHDTKCAQRIVRPRHRILRA
eukprot:scaffold158601_cov30-Tisochrysis_lutea.AAC.3